MTESFKKVTKEPILNANRVRIIALVFAFTFLILGFTWSFGLIPGLNSPSRTNSIMTIKPYRHNGTWVFDDVSVGLLREPFVAGVPEMIDFLVAEIPDADSGFRMLFSAREFPEFDCELHWVRGESGGHYYRLEEPEMEGWLCPAMFKYFDKAPPVLYVKAEPIKS